MATNIRSIATGTDTSDATATAAQILSGYTAYAKGVKLTGTASTGYSSVSSCKVVAMRFMHSINLNSCNMSSGSITIDMIIIGASDRAYATLQIDLV